MTLDEVLQRVRAEALCTGPVCTTCGAGPYRALLQKAAARRQRFLSDLEDFDPERWPQFGQPRGMMSFALDATGDPASRAKILDRWLERGSIPVWFYDSVVFDVLRSQAVAEPTRSKWIDAAEQVALESRNASLVESLFWTLGSAVIPRQALVALARELAVNNGKVRRAYNATITLQNLLAHLDKNPRADS